MDVFKVRGSSEPRQQTCLEWLQDGNPAADDAYLHRGYEGSNLEACVTISLPCQICLMTKDRQRMAKQKTL